jgi:excisionase family DNA binding protein
MLFLWPIDGMQTQEAPLDKSSPPAIMKTRDLAILLDLSPDTVNDMARRGILKGYKNGNQWRFRRRDIERYIEREKNLSPSGTG